LIGDPMSVAGRRADEVGIVRVGVCGRAA